MYIYLICFLFAHVYFVLFFLQWNSANLDDGNQVIRPFFYSQGDCSSYFESLANRQRETEELDNNPTNTQEQAQKKITRKRKRSSRFSSSTSYIARRGKPNDIRGRYLIKLNVYELKDCESENDCNDSDNACTSVQYVVRETFDDVMNAAEVLIKKIGEKLE